MSIRRKLTDYRPDPSNANQHSERGMSMLENSLSEVGLGRSIVTDKNGIILAGNATHERAVDQGFENAIEVETDGDELVVVKRRDLDLLNDPNYRARMLSVYDNRTAELSLTWTPEVLAQYKLEGVPVEKIWTPVELEQMGVGQGEQTPDPGAQVNRADELQQKWQVKPGDLFEVGAHRVLCGDSTKAEDVARVMGGEKADAVVTDPPYGQRYLQGADNRPKSQTYNHTAKRHVAVPIVGDDKHFDPQPFLNYQLVVLWGANNYSDSLPCSRGWLVWDKRDGVGSNDFADGEIAWTNRDKPLRIFHHRWSGVMRASQNGDMVLHPTEKPIELFKWCFEVCEAGNLIYDPFLGSGTTLVACEQLGRRGRGIEIEPKYVAVCLERLSLMGLEVTRSSQ